MTIGLIISFVAVLLVFMIGYGVVLQYKVKSETNKRQESARIIALIDSTDELLGHARHIPYSKELLLCLNVRILDALQSLVELDPKNKQFAVRIEDIKLQIAQLEHKHQGGESTPFKMPSSDKQAIMMLKLVKRLRDTIRNEHTKGRFETEAYVAENTRLETLQIRINIENVIKRANDAIERGKVGTALQLLNKSLEALSTKNDAYSMQAKDKLQDMLNSINQTRKDQNDAEVAQIASKDRNDDMDALFGQKKKW